MGAERTGKMAGSAGASGLIDSDILIDGLRGFPPAISFLSNQRKIGALQISVISEMELVIGCRSGQQLGNLRSVLSGLSIQQVTPSISTTASSLIDSFWLSHSLEIADALIAATAIEKNFTLFSRNLRHFRMIPGLQLTSPY